jgi:hypothetical protein
VLSYLPQLPEPALGRVAMALTALTTGLFARLEGGALRGFEALRFQQAMNNA